MPFLDQIPLRQAGPDPRLAALNFVPQELAKAVAMRSGAPQAQGIRHRGSEAARLAMYAYNGILDDGTPHLDRVVLRALAKRNPVLRLILNKILNWVLPHFKKPEGEKGVGFRVVQKDRKRPMTPAAAKEAKRLEDLFYYGGVVRERPTDGEPGAWDSWWEVKADPLRDAIRQLLYDSLVLDQTYFTIERSISGKIVFWKAEDAALIRLVDTPSYRPQIRNGHDNSDDLTGQVKYVQLSPSGIWQVDREFRWDEGGWGVRNRRTEMLAFGYGESEIEQCLMVLVGILFALQANSDFFNKNHVPQGILNLIGSYDRTDISNLRAQLHQEIGYGGGGGLYDFPIVATPDGKGNGAAWIPLQDKTRFDMVSRTYFELCAAIGCGIYGVSPEAVGLASFGGPAASLNESDPETVITDSKHSVVLPMLFFLLDLLNNNITERENPDFEAIIDGLDALYNPELLLKEQVDGLRLANGSTPNLIRAANDDPPIVVPKDPKLWRQCEEEVLVREDRGQEYFATDAVRVHAVLRLYEERGGERALWPDAPIGNSNAFAQWQQDMGLAEQQDTQETMKGMASDEAGHQRQLQAGEAGAVQGQMAQLAGAADERQAAGETADRDAAAKGELRVPQADDAAGGAFHKAVELLPVPAARPRIIIRIGGED